jgi:hypothetical protein
LKPELWDTDFSDSSETTGLGIAARGHFLKRIPNPHYPAWPISCIFRQKDDQHAKLLLGREHFGPKWAQFNVEILGLAMPVRPPMPPVPLFGLTHTYSSLNEEATSRYILWNACRIKSEHFEFVIKLHWWPNHDRIFSVDHFRFESAAEAAALRDALSIFSHGRGRKPSEYFTSNKQFLTHLNTAVLDSHGDGRIPSQIEIAEGLFPEAQDSARELRRWLKTSWRNWRWTDIVRAIIEGESGKVKGAS